MEKNRRVIRDSDGFIMGPEYIVKLLARFVKKFTILPNGCWEWNSAFGSDGKYGYIQVDSYFTNLAHRVSYELFIGKIPDGKDVDHLCRNTACVNPEHFEAVSRQVNVLREYQERPEIIRDGKGCFAGQ